MRVVYDGSLTAQQAAWVKAALAASRYPYDALGATVTVVAGHIDGHALHPYMATVPAGDGLNWTIYIEPWADDPSRPENAGIPAGRLHDFFTESFIHETGHVVQESLVNTDDLQTQLAALFWTPTAGGTGRRYGMLADFAAVETSLDQWAKLIQEAVAETFKVAFDSGTPVYGNRTNWYIDESQWAAFARLMVPAVGQAFTDPLNNFAISDEGNFHPEVIPPNPLGTVIDATSRTPWPSGAGSYIYYFGSAPAGFWVQDFGFGAVYNVDCALKGETLAYVRFAPLFVPLGDGLSHNNIYKLTGGPVSTGWLDQVAWLVVYRDDEGTVKFGLDEGIISGDAPWITEAPLYLALRKKTDVITAELWGERPSTADNKDALLTEEWRTPDGSPFALDNPQGVRCSLNLATGPYGSSPPESNNHEPSNATYVTELTLVPIGQPANPPYPKSVSELAIGAAASGYVRSTAAV